MLRRVFAANVVYDGDISRHASRETGRHLYHESPLTPRRIIIPRQVYRDEMVSRESCPWTPSCRALVLKNKKRRTPVLADKSIPAGASGARTRIAPVQLPASAWVTRRFAPRWRRAIFPAVAVLLSQLMAY